MFRWSWRTQVVKRVNLNHCQEWRMTLFISKNRVKKQKWNRTIISTSIITGMQLMVRVSSLISRREGGFPYNVLYTEGSSQKGSLFTRQIYEKVGLSLYCCSIWKSRQICHFFLQTGLEGLTDVCYGWDDKKTSCFSALRILKRRWIYRSLKKGCEKGTIRQ